MIIKSIRCTVPDGSRAAFDRAQRAWAALQGFEGFLGQVGGWDTRQPGDAVVLGLWRDAEALQRFMGGLHDDVVAANNQGVTYTASDIRTLDHVMDMPGAHPDLTEALFEGALLRTALCHVYPSAQAAFEDSQREVWRPGMNAAAGMLGGAFFQRRDGAPVYLVATLWESAEAHAAYAQDHLPRLRAASGAAAQLSAIVGGQVPLEPAWTVRP
ncbi:MAG: DUF4937 domain-containing protein [Alphaproteobacteria bacterium]|nr:DUF4937 domain-containing protein [Alphaproteobacteria bacterium]